LCSVTPVFHRFTRMKHILMNIRQLNLNQIFCWGQKLSQILINHAMEYIQLNTGVFQQLNQSN